MIDIMYILWVEWGILRVKCLVLFIKIEKVVCFLNENNIYFNRKMNLLEWKNYFFNCKLGLVRFLY